MRMSAADTAAALRDAAYGLRRLVDGDLSGMFDGPTRRRWGEAGGWPPGVRERRPVATCTPARLPSLST
jgi:hypothetical protein